MKRIQLALIVLLGIFLSTCNSDPNEYAVIETSYGDIKLKVYGSTPLHQENFMKLVDEAFYDDLLFHRVIGNFMIQGGDPDSKDAAQGARLGNGGPGYTVPSEISAPHFRGALAAARTPDNVNPKRESSGSQFFIVTGMTWDAGRMANWEKVNQVKYSPEQIEMYGSIGGRPDLDGKYTVFGEVMEGMDVVDQIANVAKDQFDRPVENLSFKIRRGK
ncbi:MAG: peptidylprolyl isomerase [Bacteroidota bacterium]